MINKHITIWLLIIILLSGCAGPTMQVKNLEQTNLRPMGLFVISSTQGLDDKDLVHRKFIINLSTEVLTNLLEDKYELRPLNDKIPHNEVFKKPFASVYIDEKKIARIAKQEGCRSVLIVYYAVTEINTAIMTSDGVYIPIGGEHSLKDDKGMKLHARCSLYGWLVSTDGARVLSKSHSVLSPFSKYIQDRNNKEQLFHDYIEYITAITNEMFLPMITNK